jgi:hypothetical protein
MRDIRGDLEERAICQEQIKAVYPPFEMMAQQLQRARDARVDDLKNHRAGNIIQNRAENRLATLT